MAKKDEPLYVSKINRRGVVALVVFSVIIIFLPRIAQFFNSDVVLDISMKGVQELLKEGGGFGLGFQTPPYLFEQLGSVMSVIAGIAWFPLLFFVGITSSLAMGTPVMAFLRDGFNWKESNTASQ
jgi:SNF family Na+-dependent transporter